MELRYGKSCLNVNIPEKNLMGVVKPRELPKLGDKKAAILKALRDPIGSKRLCEMVESGDKVVIIASDITRPSPSSKLLPPLLDELNSGGVSDEDIIVIFALGIHRGHTVEEQKKLVGDDVYNRVRCIDHDVNNCVTVGKTEKGDPIEIFKEVADADVIVCTGNIEYHYYAGYSGGAKAILPGVSSRQFIQSNHKMMILQDAYAGNIDSPVRREMDELGMIVGIDFILNVILNIKKEFVGVVAGHPIDAHRVGTKLVDEMYKIPVKRADIVITCAGGDPKDINLYQAQKALANGKHAVKEGGSIILVARCQEGYGDVVFERWVNEADTSKDLIERVKNDFELGGHNAAAIALVMEKADVYLVSDMDDEIVKNAFLIPKKSLQDALSDALNKHGADATVLVMLYGGSTLPSAD
ncbi:MAG: nickel-dependent lactate racemase [Halobacteriota archaeon]|nr:nickel-dependent lactate racemase [Halobacteriota archaeon]